MIRHIFALASGAAMALGLATSSFAAGDGFCRDYAHAAMNQVRGAMNHDRCHPQLQGARWSSDWHTHYDWCRGVSRGQAESERDARRDTLASCAHW